MAEAAARVQQVKVGEVMAETADDQSPANFRWNAEVERLESIADRIAALAVAMLAITLVIVSTSADSIDVAGRANVQGVIWGVSFGLLEYVSDLFVRVLGTVFSGNGWVQRRSFWLNWFRGSFLVVAILSVGMATLFLLAALGALSRNMLG